MPLCDRMFCCIFGWFSVFKSGWNMKKLFCCPALELFHFLPPLFCCLTLWKTVRLLTWKKATKCNKCIIISYLTKITAFFTDSKIAFLIWASEKSGMVHEISFAIICLLTTQSNPEEVVRLFTLVEYLNTESFGIVHVFDNIFGNFCLLRICVGTNPNINYTRSILWIKWNLKIADKM